LAAAAFYGSASAAFFPVLILRFVKIFFSTKAPLYNKDCNFKKKFSAG
jgi:hypothetical protein